jgi:branched-chain amino acid:cation transporter, LIVCS family
MQTQLSGKQVLAVGLMLFALFLGAGNMIFPPALGQAAGSNVWVAIVGFLITGVGLPLLGVTAIALTGSDLEKLASRVHPIFGIIFTFIVYLVIGPLFAIPRTATVSYEIGVTPFLSEAAKGGNLSLFLTTVVFFGITLWLAMNPSKLVDRVGKILTPILVVVLATLVIKAIITPMGEIGEPAEAYQSGAFFKGFIEGYLTMDTLASLVFGIVVIHAIKNFGIRDNKVLAKATIKAGAIAATGLALVYVSLAYIGATSINVIGQADNGAAILSGSATHLFGSIGTTILALAITFACLTTSIGLVSSCSEYFSKVFPKVSYKTFVIILSIFSMIIANVGLTQLIQISIPVLLMVYPLAIVIMFLSFLPESISGHSPVYVFALIGAAVVSIVDGLAYTSLDVSALQDVLSLLPLYSQGVGWLVPSLVGAILGYIIAQLGNKQNGSNALKKAS